MIGLLCGMAGGGGRWGAGVGMEGIDGTDEEIHFFLETGFPNSIRGINIHDLEERMKEALEKGDINFLKNVWNMPVVTIIFYPSIWWALYFFIIPSSVNWT